MLAKAKNLKLNYIYTGIGLPLKRNITKSFAGPWNYVNGERCDSLDNGRSAGQIKVIEPATGKPLCSVSIADKQDVHEAVSAAKSAFLKWKEVSPKERGKYLIKAGSIIRENLEDLAQLKVKDNGKPIWEARIDIESCADALEYYGGIAPTILGQHVPLEGGSFAMVTREPYGVVAGIGAWNYPLTTCVWKVAPALVCGNTFVYKPSQFTPVTAPVLGEIFSDAGLPKGVYNVIQGEGETGSLLCNHPEVEKISFTGSVPTGVKVMEAGARGIKAVTLELGGKSPLIIFDDCHLENAVKATLMANFLSQGQVCSNGTRVFVHKSIADKFTDLLVRQTKQLKVGDPFSEDTTVGATIHEAHARKVISYIQTAKDQGAKVLCGGERVLLSGDLAEGWYLSPCILKNVTPDMKIFKEEVFGSVLSLMEFTSEKEAVELANQTSFGLAGGVFTKDIQRGHRVARSIDAGSVWINTYNLYLTSIPFGGFKKSGIGRESGTAAIDNFTQTKTIYVEMGDVDCGPLYRE